jgi:hypothetical protein
MSMMLGGMNVVGDYDEPLAVMGAQPHHAAIARYTGISVPTPAWMNAAHSQGVSRPQEEMDFLPFASAVLTGAALTGFLLARPQRPFRGERIVIDAIKSDGTDASKLVVVDPAMYVGAVQIGAAQGAATLTAFQATAFGVRLSFPAAGQGTDIKIFVRALVDPGEGNSFVVTATLIGRAMR